MENQRALDTKKFSRNHMRECEELLSAETRILDGVNGAGQSVSKEHPASNRGTKKMPGNHIVSHSLFNGATPSELRGRYGSQNQTQTTMPWALTYLEYDFPSNVLQSHLRLPPSNILPLLCEPRANPCGMKVEAELNSAFRRAPLTAVQISAQRCAMGAVHLRPGQNLLEKAVIWLSGGHALSYTCAPIGYHERKVCIHSYSMKGSQ